MRVQGISEMKRLEEVRGFQRRNFLLHRKERYSFESIGFS